MSVAEARGALLMALRVKGAADVQRLADAARLKFGDCATSLELLARESLLRMHPRLSKYVLTDAGKEAVAVEVAQVRKAVGAPVLAALYDRFSGLDAEFKQLASAWQVRAPGPPVLVNDHSDPRYDQRIVNQLVRLHHRLKDVLEPLGAKCPRYEAYVARCADALIRLNAGSLDHLTNPRVDSYHNIWFELHEDLLCILGRQRSE